MHYPELWRTLVRASLVFCFSAAGLLAATPRITSVQPPPAGTFSAATRVTVKMLFDLPTTVTGTPTLGTTIGGTARQFRYTTSSVGSGVTFEYHPVAGDTGTLNITGPISLNGGTIKGSDGTDAALSFAPVMTQFALDTTPPAAPVITAVTPASPVTGKTFTISGTAEPNGTALFRFPSASAPVSANGDWSITFPSQSAGPHTYQVVALDRAGNASAVTNVTFTVVPDPSAARPVVSNASVVGQVGTPLNTVQVSATNRPDSFSAPGLAAYGLSIGTTGLITGTPTVAANGVDVAVTATNGGGTSEPANIRLNITSYTTPVIQVVPPGDGFYGNWFVEREHWMTISVRFSGPVKVTGSPTLVVRIGARSERLGPPINLAGWGGTTTSLAFLYIPSGEGALTITGPLELNGSSIKGAQGEDVPVAFAPVAAPGVIIDTVLPLAPVIKSVTPAAPTTADTFVVSGTAEAGVTIKTNVDGSRPGSQSAPVDANGNWTITVPAQDVIPYQLFFYAEDRARNTSPGGPEVAVVAPTTRPGTAAPVLSNATVSGQIGIAIAPVQITATNNPTSFIAPGLAAYGLTINATGLISGTPTTTASGATVPVTAANTAGTSAAATITINIAAASAPPATTTPPPATTPPPVVGPPSPTTPPVVVMPPTTPPQTTPPPGTALATQTIQFLAPVSAPIMGQPFALSATASSGLPVTFSVVSGNATIERDSVIINGPGDVVVRATQAGNATTAAATAEVTISGAVKAAQTITFAAPASKLSNDAPFTLSATASSGQSVTFSVVSGPATIAGNEVTLTGASGTVVIRAAAAGNETTLAAELTRTLTVAAAPSSRLANISSRLQVSDSDPDRTFITGFVVAGTSPQRVLIRAAGPALRSFGVDTALANPRLQLFDSAGRVVGENDDWTGSDIGTAGTQVGAFALAPGSRDAALVTTLAPGAYTVHILANGGDGVALAEVYDASPTSDGAARPPLTNLSTRGYVGTGEAQVAVGFVITGNAAKRVLVRGVGAALQAFGVAGALSDPELMVYRGPAAVAGNNDWNTATAVSPDVAPASVPEIVSATTRVGGFALAANSKDAAVLVTLAPGVYTAVVSGNGATSGVALVEVYEVRD